MLAVVFLLRYAGLFFFSPPLPAGFLQSVSQNDRVQVMIFHEILQHKPGALRRFQPMIQCTKSLGDVFVTEGLDESRTAQRRLFDHAAEQPTDSVVGDSKLAHNNRLVCCTLLLSFGSRIARCLFRPSAVVWPIQLGRPLGAKSLPMLGRKIRHRTSLSTCRPSTGLILDTANIQNPGRGSSNRRNIHGAA